MIIQIPPKKPFGTDFSAYWEEFLTENEIELILNLPEWKNKKDALIGSRTDEEGVYDPKIRESQISWMRMTDETLPIWAKLANVVSEVNRRHFHFDLTACYELAQLSYYSHEKKSHYDWHTDLTMENSSDIPRKLSMSLLLNDPSEFEGGELQLKTDSDVPKSLELKKGRAWFFPSFLLHRVTPVTKGERKSLVLWIHGPYFK